MTFAHYRRWRRCGPIQPKSTSVPVPIGVETCLRWLKADAISGLNDGDLISTLPDSTGIYDGTSSGAFRPTYKTNIINGLPVARFAGNHHINFGEIALRSASYFIVWSRTNAANNDAVLGYSSTAYPYLQYGSTWYTANGVSAAVAMSAGTFMLKSCIYSGTQHLRYTNGSAEAAQNSTALMYIASIGLSGFNLNGDVAEVLVYGKALTSDDRQVIENYLNAKYALW